MLRLGDDPTTDAAVSVIKYGGLAGSDSTNLFAKLNM
jgi:hypothetical protein